MKPKTLPQNPFFLGASAPHLASAFVEGAAAAALPSVGAGAASDGADEG
jgi:hypothetical protein